MKDSTGRSLWVDSLALGQPSLLCGHPVELDDYVPAISAGSYSILFGDFAAGYVVPRRLGVRMIPDLVTKKGYTKLYIYERVGGAVANPEAIKIVKFATG